MTDDLLAALAEWMDARRALITADNALGDIERWRRLADAEARLAALASRAEGRDD